MRYEGWMDGWMDGHSRLYIQREIIDWWSEKTSIATPRNNNKIQMYRLPVDTDEWFRLIELFMENDDDAGNDCLYNSTDKKPVLLCRFRWSTCKNRSKFNTHCKKESVKRMRCNIIWKQVKFVYRRWTFDSFDNINGRIPTKIALSLSCTERVKCQTYYSHLTFGPVWQSFLLFIKSYC